MKNILQRAARKVRRKLFPKTRKVDFMICGTQKGGTSALNAYLREHPEVCMGDRKEIHFFDGEKYFKNKSPDYSLYHDHFSPQKTHKLVGEATPEYMYWYYAPRRIWEYNPQAKLIISLRNPVERAHSQWNMQVARQQENLSFGDAIRCEETRRKEALPLQHRNYSYIDRGFYVEQLKRVFFYFERNQVLILKNEDLRNNPAETMGRVCNFLQIPYFEKVEKKDVHSRPYQEKMKKEERDYLQSIYQYEIRALERFLDWDCSDWLSK